MNEWMNECLLTNSCGIFGDRSHFVFLLSLWELKKCSVLWIWPTSEAVPGLWPEHRDDSCPGAVSLSHSILQNVSDLIQISEFITEQREQSWVLQGLLLLCCAFVSACADFSRGWHYVPKKNQKLVLKNSEVHKQLLLKAPQSFRLLSELNFTGLSLCVCECFGYFFSLNRPIRLVWMTHVSFLSTKQREAFWLARLESRAAVWVNL